MEGRTESHETLSAIWRRAARALLVLRVLCSDAKVLRVSCRRHERRWNPSGRKTRDCVRKRVEKQHVVRHEAKKTCSSATRTRRAIAPNRSTWIGFGFHGNEGGGRAAPTRRIRRIETRRGWDRQTDGRAACAPRRCRTLRHLSRRKDVRRRCSRSPGMVRDAKKKK